MNSIYCILLFLINIGIVIGQDLKNPLISNDDKIIFGLVDITIEINENNEIYKIEAFKTKDNDEIFNKNNPSEYSKLAWVSIGSPKLVKLSKNNVFYFTEHAVFARVSMLTETYKQSIADAIKTKYRVNVTTNQITTMSLSRFECETSIYERNRLKVIRGQVKNFAKFPLELQFPYPKQSNERLVFQNYPELNFDCVIKAGAAQKKTNILTINLNQFTQLGIMENLFGPANEVYVTRNQLSNLAFDVFTSLDIVEEYQMSEKEFDLKFVDGLVTQTATNAFNQVPIDEALQKLSKYSTNFEKDLTSDLIKEDLGKLYEIKKYNDKKLIKLNEENLQEFKNKYSGEGETKAKADVKVPVIDISVVGELGVSGKTAKENDETKSKKSLDEQLKEINSENNNQIEFQIKGEKVIPKSLYVAKLIKSTFKKTLTFNRIRKESFDAIFERDIQLSTFETNNHFEIPVKHEQISEVQVKSNNELESCLKEKLDYINEINTLNEEIKRLLEENEINSRDRKEDKREYLFEIFNKYTLKSTINLVNGNNFSWLNGFSILNDNETLYYVTDSEWNKINIFDENWNFINSKTYPFPHNIATINNTLFITSENSIYKTDKNLILIHQYNATNSPRYYGMYYNRTNYLIYVAAFDSKRIDIFDFKLLDRIDSIDLSTYPYPYSIQGHKNNLYIGTYNGQIIVVSNKKVVKTFNGCNGCSDYITSIIFDNFGYMGTSSSTGYGYLFYPNGTLTNKRISAPANLEYISFDSKARLVLVSTKQIGIYY